MKSHVRKLGAFTLCSAFFLLTLAPARVRMGTQASLPVKAKDTLETAIGAWNSLYESVSVKNWSYERRISNGNELEQVVKKLTDPAQAWFPNIDVNRPQEIGVFRVADIHAIQSQQIRAWREDIAKMVRIGHHVARLTWRKGELGWFCNDR